jgi:hypothetical protein
MTKDKIIDLIIDTYHQKTNKPDEWYIDTIGRLENMSNNRLLTILNVLREI